ncbi:EAL domain-containing protein [Sphingomonas abietis]|uniref:EAL domain-containing protein n=1 Tax=Sphingomonas abietis TaxID=3012344 RepID=A0ABY7NNI1_9SPHN|nr:EAL domain-containing protein [Sphingomonas abietis]WBO22036.1 EAL domain-containing protein [Sphingomonas abietis]
MSGHRLNLKILAAAICISLACGMVNLLGPLEFLASITRAKLRSHPPSGQVVVVAIDEQSINTLGPTPWPRGRYADLIRRLHNAGARRIGIDALPWGSDSPIDDAAFEKALTDAKGTVILPVRVTTDNMTGRNGVELPPNRLIHLAQIASTNLVVNWDGMVYDSPYTVDMGGGNVPSMASALATRRGDAGSSFPIDYGIDLRAFPTISAADILNDRWDATRLSGKDVLIGETVNTLRYGAPEFGQLPMVYLHAEATESLREGNPIAAGWLIPALIATGFAALYLFGRRRLLARFVITAGFALFVFGPLAADRLHVYLEIMPSLALLTAASVSRIWFNLRQTLRNKGLVNAVSGQANLNALREVGPRLTPTVIVARILNYAEVTISLPGDYEKDLVEQIVNRLSVGAHRNTIYQADDGLFIWLADTANEEFIGEQLMALHALFRSPVVVAGRLIDLAVTFGLDTDITRSLVQRVSSAVVAADRAASEGRRWMTYDPAELENAEWKMSLLARLDQAVEHGEIWVAYQPKVEMATGRIIGAEALARWSHPEKGEVPPSQFIPAAERSGRIENLTAHILDSAVAATASIHRAGHTDFSIAVNLSARLLDSPSLLTMVADTLARHAMEPRHLILEITETTAMTSQDGIVQALEKLSASGVRLSIDDYGTGFSTLDYLKRIPADEIKIDRSFVSMLEKSQSDRIMVHSTIQLAHSLGRRAVAEGVENAVVLNELRLMQCDYVQGYFTGKPMKFSALMETLPSLEKRAIA